MIKNLHKPLLSRREIRGFNLLKRVDSVKQEKLVFEWFSSVFKDLGKFEGSIELSCRITQSCNYSSTSSHSLTGTSYRKELNCMEKMGVISPIQ